MTPGRINVHLTPRGGRDAITGWAARDDGIEILQVRVAAPAVGGSANTSLRRLIAKATGAPVSVVLIVGGLHSRTKVLAIDGLDEREIRARIDGHIMPSKARG